MRFRVPAAAALVTCAFGVVATAAVSPATATFQPAEWACSGTTGYPASVPVTLQNITVDRTGGGTSQGNGGTLGTGQGAGQGGTNGQGIGNGGANGQGQTQGQGATPILSVSAEVTSAGGVPTGVLGFFATDPTSGSPLASSPVSSGTTTVTLPGTPPATSGILAFDPADDSVFCAAQTPVG